ncbi:hypothetical protein [Cesiribacter andamanensis]|uniref:Uncharacterized protein n=1 Tax=Cesiribacter andamanensis AMV16 TaxID=1279009 RepID=M7P2L6_9BACT|nr:hypothetical protein [Cesiribacter andamanensis]EMR04774.1 hypothetical protein ADICEAN_00045 [Cesiribacter andamanensis AMV16]
MSIILLILAGTAAGGVVRALFEMRQQAREHRQKKEALKKFEQEHPGR